MKPLNKNARSHSNPHPLTYWEYLNLDKLLELQGGAPGDHAQPEADELHFIIVHQVFELWFKQVIRELELARDKMMAPKVDEEVIPFVVHHLNRVNTIMESAIKHFDVMETLTPQDFLVFRSRLGTASGFQSFQMREIELLLGLEPAERKTQNHGNPVKYLLKSSKDTEMGEYISGRIEKAKAGPSLRQVMETWLYRTPIQGSAPADPGDEAVISRFISAYLDAMKAQNETQIEDLLLDGGDETVIRSRFDAMVSQAGEFLLAADAAKDRQKKVSRVRAAVLFIESYRELPLLSWPRLLLDTAVQLEENFISFRFRHARMVERVIGRRVGTGGSDGVDYLDQTTKYRIFKDLWAVRTLLLPAGRLPPLENPGIYGFSLDREG
jgi:tryptophan 2,3-dioxygenase